MKNILGKKEDLELFNADGTRVYSFEICLTGYWHENTYDSNGNTLIYKNSNGYWLESTYDDNGNELTHKNSDGYWSERTYDDNGNQLTYKNSNGITRGFDVKEYTMEELTEKLGHNFKIKK